MCITRSTPEKEYAAALFLKWFTSPEQNMKFVSSTGYLPVTKQAFEVSMAQEIDEVENENIKKLLQAAITMYQNYEFYIPPTFDSFDAIGKTYQSGYKSVVLQKQKDYRSLQLSQPDNAPLSVVTKNAYNDFIRTVQP